MSEKSSYRKPSIEDTAGLSSSRGSGRGSRESCSRTCSNMVQVEMGVAEGMDELSRPEPGHLGYHHGEQSVARDVERDTRGTRRRSAGRAGRRAAPSTT